MNSELIGNRFRIISKVGEGQFGMVYLCKDTKTLKNCAVKVPKPTSFSSVSQLLNEGKVLKVLQGLAGIPKFIKLNIEEGHEFISMQLLGQNLEQKFVKNQKQFSLATILTVADQLLERLESIHSKGIIHRDLKPRQLLLDLDSTTISLIDFGLSREYLQKSINLHIPYTEGRQFEGTAYFASLNTHMGIQQSRRDDLESFLYVIAYFMMGTLPWMADKSKKISEREIKVIKNRVSSTSLFADKPEEFRLMMKYVKNLEFDRKPDYQYLRNLLKSIRVKNCLIGIGFEFPIGHKKIIIKSKSIHSEKHRKSHRLRHSLDEEEKSDSVLQPKRSVSSYETCQLTVRTDFDGKCVWIDDDSTMFLSKTPEIRDRSILKRNKTSILTDQPKLIPSREDSCLIF